MSKFKLANIFAYGFVTLFSIYVLLPIIVMILTTFKTRREIFLEPLGLPGQFNFSSFEKALSIGLGGFIFNSFLVSLFSVNLLIVAGFAIPPAAVLVPLYVTVSNLGLLNSIYGVVMPLTAFGIPFTVILFNAFFLDFPREVEEAATIDGCSKMQIFFRIIIPLSGPAIASAAIFQTVWIWNEFLLALIMLTSDEVITLPHPRFVSRNFVITPLSEVLTKEQKIKRIQDRRWIVD